MKYYHYHKNNFLFREYFIQNENMEQMEEIYFHHP